jgi:hypothetical protein
MARLITVPGIGDVNVPDGATDAEINYFVNKVQQAGSVQAAVDQAKQETPGRWGAGVDRFQAGIEALLSKAAQDIGGSPRLASNLARAAEANVIEAAKYQPAVPSYKDIRGVGDLGSYALDLAASSAPDIAVSAIGGLTGGIVGGPLGAVAGATLPAFTSLTGQNILSQAQEQGVPIGRTSLGRAAVAAVPQTVLQSVTPVRFLGKIRVLPAAVRRATIGKVASEIAVSGAYEGLTEAAQQAIQIAQANPDKFFEFGPDVQNEILEAAVGGGLLGGLGEGVVTAGRTPLNALYKNRAEARTVKNTVNIIRDRKPIGDLGIQPFEVQAEDGTKKTIHNVVDGTGRVFRGFDDPATAQKVIDRFNQQRQKAAPKTTEPAQPTEPGAPPAETPPVSPSVFQRLAKIPIEQERQNPQTRAREVVKSETPIIDYSGRKIAVMNVDGVNVPFYQSTGLGGKAETKPGKWYPFFGIGPDGWINKTSGLDMSNYYGSPKLRAAAETLDREIGDIRHRKDLPAMPATGLHAEFINAGLDPVENKPENADRLKSFIGQFVDRIERGPVPEAPTSPIAAPEPPVAPGKAPPAPPEPSPAEPVAGPAEPTQFPEPGLPPVVGEPPVETPPVAPAAPIAPGPTPVLGKKKGGGKKTPIPLGGPVAPGSPILEGQTENLRTPTGATNTSLKGISRDWATYTSSADSPNAAPWLSEIQNVIDELALTFGLPMIPRVYSAAAKPKASGTNGQFIAHPLHGTSVIVLSKKLDRTAAIAVALHELGHAVDFYLLERAPQDVKDAIIRDWKASKNFLTDFAKVSGVKPITAAEDPKYYDAIIKNMPQSHINYLMGKSEWFAEQVSRYLTQRKEPQTVVERFFSGIADVWRKIYDKLTSYIPISNSVEEFLNGHWRPDLVSKRLNPKGAKSNLLVFTPKKSLAPGEEGGSIYDEKTTDTGVEQELPNPADLTISQRQESPPNKTQYEVEVEDVTNQDTGPSAAAPNFPYMPKVVNTTPESYKASQGHMVYGAAAYRLANFLDRIFQNKWAKRFIPAELTGEKAADTFMIALADKMLPVGKVVDYIRAAGGTVLDAFDPYLREEQMYGIVNERLIDAEANLYKPVTDAIKRNNLSIDDVNEYLYALHAPERNERMRLIGNTDPERGSGMSDDDAAAIIKKVKADPKYAAYEEVRGLVRKIIDNTNDVRVEAGLIPKEMPPQVITLKNGDKIEVAPYREYFPLRGFADEATEGGSEMYANTGKGLKIRGKEDKSALGRKSRASDIMTHVMLQNTEAVVRAEKNKVGRAFHDLIQHNMFLPKEGFDVRRDYGIEILKAAPMRLALNKNGVLQFVPDAMYKSRDDVFVFKMDGKEVAIKIGDPALRKALIAKPFSGPESVGKIIRMFGWFNRKLAMVNTGLNPEFMLTNLPRDLEQALISIGQYDIKGIEKNVFLNVRKALTGAYRVIRDQNAKGEWEDVFRDFAANGGMTSGIAGIRDFETRIKKIQELAKDDPSTAQARALQAAKSVFGWLEDVNSAFENSIRVSVYKSLLDAGLSKARAAQAAKNLTVNFDKKGQYGQYINSFYLFFNASAQGMLSMGLAIARSQRVRKRVAGLVMLGFMQDILNSLFGEEDKDGEKFYDKIPSYKLERNLIIMMPGTKDYVAIPLPPGFSFFFNAGRVMGRRIRGKYSTAEASSNILSTFVDATNPLGGTETFLNFLFPTALDPLVSLTANIDFTGKKIAPDGFPGAVPRPNSQMHWANTNPAYVTAADWLSKLSGGTDYVPGLFEVKPDQMQYLAEFMGGGLAAFAGRSYNAVTNEIPKLLRGDLENMDINTLPVFRRLVGNVSDRVQTEDYMDKVNHVLQRGMELDAAKKEGDLASVKAAQENYAGELRIYHQVKQLNNRRSRLASDLKKLRENPKISPEQMRIRSEQIQNQIRSVMEQVNILYGKNVKENPLGLF